MKKIEKSKSSSDQKQNKVNDHVANYRARVEREGLKRVETTVPVQDADLVKQIAGVLRSGGHSADELRISLRSLLPAGQAQTGSELLDFFRTSPILSKQEEYLFETQRDGSTGRTADFE